MNIDDLSEFLQKSFGLNCTIEIIDAIDKINLSNFGKYTYYYKLIINDNKDFHFGPRSYIKPDGTINEVTAKEFYNLFLKHKKYFLKRKSKPKERELLQKLREFLFSDKT